MSMYVKETILKSFTVRSPQMGGMSFSYLTQEKIKFEAEIKNELISNGYIIDEVECRIRLHRAAMSAVTLVFTFSARRAGKMVTFDLQKALKGATVVLHWGGCAKPIEVKSIHHNPKLKWPITIVYGENEVMQSALADGTIRYGSGDYCLKIIE